ncbi:uncharacterized protein LOC126908046 [Daktulosphaira vitifoliae]|uniref:uncharacterized protein LOC126908046 n=1 Tax=Daktulosphaira vitifoliae TaxID=58002 RepID=UPI0021AA2FB6|nr:uncharacterized protein LOC126908046 [Daktulosphaira vitifoliae]XP_050545841.1 uncharacterized protein LOC126908046 [Daktulosphaira vitifoliae]XP_050545842.1 uncharacterized protein LOC126908046 [Daktulosphaira vitifoliae]
MATIKNLIRFFILVIFCMNIVKGVPDITKNDLIEAARAIELTNKIINRIILLKDGNVIRYADTDEFYDVLKNIIYKFKSQNYVQLVTVFIPLKIEQIRNTEYYNQHVAKQESVLRRFFIKDYSISDDDYKIFIKESNVNYIDAAYNREKISMLAIRHLLYTMHATEKICSNDNIKCKLMGIENQLNTHSTKTKSVQCTENEVCEVEYEKYSKNITEKSFFINLWCNELNTYSTMKKDLNGVFKYYLPEGNYLTKLYYLEGFEGKEEVFEFK